MKNENPKCRAETARSFGDVGAVRRYGGSRAGGSGAGDPSAGGLSRKCQRTKHPRNPTPSRRRYRPGIGSCDTNTTCRSRPVSCQPTRWLKSRSPLAASLPWTGMRIPNVRSIDNSRLGGGGYSHRRSAITLDRLGGLDPLGRHVRGAGSVERHDRAVRCWKPHRVHTAWRGNGHRSAARHRLLLGSGARWPTPCGSWNRRPLRSTAKR